MGKATKFRFAVRKFEPFENTMQKIWAEFCLLNNIQIEAEFVAMDLPELHQEIITSGGLKNGNWDAAHIVTDWLDEAYSANSLEILNPYLEKNAPEDSANAWSNSLLQTQIFSNNEIVGLPFHDGPECLIYRKDLFDSETEKQAFKVKYGKDLAVPSNWDDFLQIAEFFQRPVDNLYGTVLAAFPDGHNTVYDFCLQLWARGGEVTKNGIIDIDSEQAVEALTFYRNWVNNQNITHPKSKEYESVNCGLAFARGEAAMMINWFGFAAMCEVADFSKVKGKVDVAKLPSKENIESSSLNIYWLYAIGTGSENKDLAYDFIRFATTKANDKLLTLEGGIGCRKSTWSDTDVNAIIPYYHKLEELHQNAKTLPRTAKWAVIAEIIDEMVLLAINTQEDTATLIASAQAKIKELD
jgi:multiple sugar transport system substrate-binding protein